MFAYLMTHPNRCLMQLRNPLIISAKTFRKRPKFYDIYSWASTLLSRLILTLFSVTRANKYTLSPSNELATGALNTSLNTVHINKTGALNDCFL